MSSEPDSRKPIYPPAFLLMAFVLMMALHLLAPVRQLLVSPYRYLGLIPLAAGVVLVLSVAKMFDHAGTTIRPFQSSTSLILRGPYRVTRNPIYLGMVIALMGIGMLLGSATPFLVVPAFALLIDRRFIRAEETILERTFGAEYAGYKGRVRRWL